MIAFIGNIRGDYMMDIQLIGHIVSQFKYLSLIVNKDEDILWISPGFKSINQGGFVTDPSLKDFIGKGLEELRDDNYKVSINDIIYKISETRLQNGLMIISAEMVGDYSNPEVKLFLFEKVIDDLYDGVLITDREGEIIVYNRAMEELEKMDTLDMMGKKIWDAYGYRDKSKSEHMKVFESKEPIINRYKAHAYNNGKPIYKSYTTRPIEKDGEIIGVYSISKNETKLRSLLSEIVELKRQFNDPSLDKEKRYNNGTRYTFSDIVGSSPSIVKVIREAQAIAWLDNSILIVGDTGTGKEVFAQSIHNFAKRKNEPFIGINCSAIPENLLESILFGSVKGAYTGAVDSSGLFEEAGKGSLFLDELNSMPINMQTKLLRVLQERRVRRVGGKESYPVNCRIISAMNEDPYTLMEEGKLRQDLFYRISGYNLYIPSLIDRENDIYALAEYFIHKFNALMGKNVSGVSEDLKKVMSKYKWPGNIRELEHFIENVMVRTEDDSRVLEVGNIPDHIADIMKTKNISKNDQLVNNYDSLEDSLAAMEKGIIIKELNNRMWNVSRTAKALGITRQSLIYRMKKFNIERRTV